MTAPSPDLDEAAIFHEGIALFNDGDWFEAHEVWEDIWHLATGERKRFYQGLIQCAVTIEHIRRGNPRGVRSVWATAQEKFQGIDGVYMGVNVPGLLADMKRTVDPILVMPAERFAPGQSRGQDLPVNWQAMPRIELAYDPFA